MYVNKLEHDKGELEIVYDVQWKTPGNDDDKAKIIGIVDTADTNLDWNTFKSYLIQNSGNMRFTTDDIRISYLDSDDDLIPVDSELEFRECLKFSRTRARRGRKIMMKVGMMPGVSARAKEQAAEASVTKYSKPKLFCVKKKDIPEKLLKKSVLSKAEKPPTVEVKEAMPEWFEKYMIKFKEDLVQDITMAVVSNIRSTMKPSPPAAASGARSRSVDIPSTSTAPSKGHHHHYQLHQVLEKRKKKKKMPEEDSSDCTDGLQLQWEERLELLRHMQKISKRDKKFEKKLDAKLEKLECKTKKIMEKKHCLWSGKKNPAVVQSSAPAAAPVCQLVMDATPVEEYNYVPHVLRGELIAQVWTVMNNGQLPWTDETELRFAWGSKSLLPLTTVAKVPLLKPGETGQVKVTLQAPLFPGNFESYWHFHHQGHRFGHWLGCSVIVEKDPVSPQPLQPKVYSSVETSIPVDLTMKCTQQPLTNTSDDVKIYKNTVVEPIAVKPSKTSTDTTAEPSNTGLSKSVVTSTNCFDESAVPKYSPVIMSTDTTAKPSNTGLESFVRTTNCFHPISMSKYSPATFKMMSESLKKHTSNSNNSSCSSLSKLNVDNTNAGSKASSCEPSAGHSTQNIDDTNIPASSLKNSSSSSQNSNNLDSSPENCAQFSNNLSAAKPPGNPFETEAELEEFPTLDSYRLMSHGNNERYPDLVQATEDTTSQQQNWHQYCSNNDGQSAEQDAGQQPSADVEAIIHAVEDLMIEEQNTAGQGVARDEGGNEYISGSDTDNISIISTVSLDTDDTEPSDEFVVVPMPTCVNCEQPIETQQTDSLPVTQPISVEIPKTPSDSDISAVQPSDSNNNTEMKPYPVVAATAGANTSTAAQQSAVLYPAMMLTGENSSSSGDMAADSTAQDLSELQDEEIPILKSDGDETTVYVRDSSGVSRPVAKVFIHKEQHSPRSPPAIFGGGVSVRHSTFGDPNFGQGPNGPRFPFGFNAEGGSPPPHCHNPGGPCNFRPQHESPPSNVPYSVSVGLGGNIQTARINNSSDTFCSHFCQADSQQQQQQSQIPVELSQSSYSYTATASAPPQPPVQPATEAQPQPQPAGNGQCILIPPTFYQDLGAMASSIEAGMRTTANQMHQKIHTEQPRPTNIRVGYKTTSGTAQKKRPTKKGSTTSSSGSRRSSSESHDTSPVAAAVQILPETLVTGAVNVASSAINTARSVIDMLRPRHEEPPVAQWEQIPPEVERSLRTLQEMGFNNRELNVMLLAQHNNDVTRVISELVQ